MVRVRMFRYSFPFSAVAALCLAFPGGMARGVVEPPLPGEEGPVTTGEAFSLLPGPGEIPAESIPGAGEDEVVTPPPVSSPMDETPGLEPLGMPSDGEPMPELPPIPGLVLPGRSAAAPAGGTVPPAFSNPVPDLLPPPELQLAKKSAWVRSPIEARKLSAAQGKPLLIFFAQMRPGDDGSGTARLNDDLFATDEFNEFAAAKLVLTKLQYPVGSPNKNIYPEAKLAALQKFKDFFKPRGFPAIILLDDQGREMERIQGYRRVSEPGSGVEYSTAHVALDRLKEAVHRWEEKYRYRQERIANLKSQGYRVWTSRKGSTMMGKLVEAKPERIVLKDENGRHRQVQPAQLILYDAEWARRKEAGLLPEALEKAVSAAGEQVNPAAP